MKNNLWATFTHDGQLVATSYDFNAVCKKASDISPDYKIRKVETMYSRLSDRRLAIRYYAEPIN